MCSTCNGGGNCNGHGTCNSGALGDGTCTCDEHWYGDHCRNVQCPPGQWWNSVAPNADTGRDGACVGCTTGRYSEEGMVGVDAQCVQCPRGTYSPVTGRTSCYSCPGAATGAFTEGPGSMNFEQCKCPDGYLTCDDQHWMLCGGNKTMHNLEKDAAYTCMVCDTAVSKCDGKDMHAASTGGYWVSKPYGTGVFACPYPGNCLGGTDQQQEQISHTMTFNVTGRRYDYGGDDYNYGHEEDTTSPTSSPTEADHWWTQDATTVYSVAYALAHDLYTTGTGQYPSYKVGVTVTASLNTRRADSVSLSISYPKSTHGSKADVAQSLTADTFNADVLNTAKTEAGVTADLPLPTALSSATISSSNSSGCKEGSQGPLCGICDTAAGWAMSSEGCYKCDSSRMSTGTIIMNAILAGLLLLLLTCAAWWLLVPPRKTLSHQVQNDSLKQDPCTAVELNEVAVQGLEDKAEDADSPVLGGLGLDASEGLDSPVSPSGDDKKDEKEDESNTSSNDVHALQDMLSGILSPEGSDADMDMPMGEKQAMLNSMVSQTTGGMIPGVGDVGSKVQEIKGQASVLGQLSGIMSQITAPLKVRMAR